MNCQTCSNELLPAARFCSRCGPPVTQAPTLNAVVPATPPPSPYDAPPAPPRAPAVTTQIERGQIDPALIDPGFVKAPTGPPPAPPAEGPPTQGLDDLATPAWGAAAHETTT